MGSSTAASLLAQLDGTPRPGQVAAIVARSGVGKTPVAVRVALHHLLAGGRVLHVAFGDSVEHVRRHYAQVARGDTDRLALASAERNRMIHTYVGGGFDEGRFRASLAMWVDIAGFEPDLILFDLFMLLMTLLGKATWSSFFRYNFKNDAQWEACFERLGLEIVQSGDVVMTERYPVRHRMYLLEKKPGL